MMVTANEPNMESGTNGIIPRMVVRLAIITGRRRDLELWMSATRGSMPCDISRVISSIRTIPFLIIMPISPSTPTIATNPNGLPVSITTGITPIITNGMQQKMMAGFL